MNIDSSAVSRTISESSQAQSLLVFSMENMKGLEKSFPFYDTMSQSISLPSIMYILAVFYFSFQVIMTSIWEISSNLVTAKNRALIEKMSKIAFWIGRESESDEYSSLLVVFSSFFALTVLLIYYEMKHYFIHRRFVMWMLYPVRFLCEIFPIVALHPIANFLGFQYLKVRNVNASLNETLIGFLLLMIFAFFAKVSLTTYSFLSISPFLGDNILSIDDHKALGLFIAFNPIFRVFNIGFSANQQWTQYILVIIHIFFLIYLLTKISFVPFFSRLSNVVFLSLCYSCIGFDGIKLLFHFIKQEFDYFLMVFVPILILICAIGSMYYQHKRISIIVKDLSMIESENNMTEEEKIERLNSLGFDSGLFKLRMYIHYGLSKNCDLFNDFSLIRFALQRYEDPSLFCYCIKFLSYFPSEDRLMSKSFNEVLKSRTLKLEEKFMLYQVHRIKLLRQSSSSNSSIDRLIKMKHLSKQCEGDIKSFWKNTHNGSSFFHFAQESTDSLKSLWIELLNDFPNSTNHHEEYCRFLIECVTDIQEAVVIKYKIGLIETGSSFAVDHCFKSMVRCFPQYLKKGILDMKGNFLSRKKKSGSQGPTSNSHSYGSSNSLIDIDARLEEEIGKALVSQIKLRLALQYATKNFVASNSNPLLIFSAIFLIFSVSSISILYWVLTLFFNGRYADTERSYMISELHTCFTLSSLYSLLHWGNMSLLTGFDEYNSIFYKNTSHHLLSNVPLNYKTAAIENNFATRAYYQKFIQSLAQLASSESIDVYQLTGVFIDNVVPIIYCHNGSRAKYEYIDLKTILAYEYMSINILINKDNFDEWWTSEELFCSLFSTYPHIITSFMTVRERLDKFQQNKSLAISSSIDLSKSYLPIAYLIIAFIPPLIVILLYNYEVKKLKIMLNNIDIASKSIAESPLMKRFNEENEEIFLSDKIISSNIFVLWNILIFLGLVVLMVVIFFYILSETNDLNNMFYSNSQWSYYSSIRSSLISDCVLYLNLLAFLQDPIRITTNATNSTFLSGLLMAYGYGIHIVKDLLLMGNNRVKPMMGNDPFLDSLAVQEQCKPPPNADIHDIYECGSTNQQTSMFTNLISEIINQVHSFNGSAKSFLMANMYHLAIEHLIPNIQRMDRRLNSLMEDDVISFSTYLFYFLVLGICVSIINYLVLLNIRKIMDSAHKAGLMLLRRVPPSGIVANKTLVDYLVGRNFMKEKNDLSISSTVFHKTSDGIACVSLSGVIEEINESITKIFGSTPEQLLGQPIKGLFSEEDSQKLIGQMALISSNQTSNSYEGYFECVNDSEQKIHCKISLHGISLSSNKDISMYVLIIRDETELINQQEVAEEAKKKSETLLFQILPRDIIVRLNQGEKEITFVVPHASIMFIDIVKFSEYTVSLTPQEIFGNLSMLFGAFDESILKYPLITKIKLIGDVYMCAAGLFSNDDSPKSHAVEMVRFALDCLQKLEDINLKLNASLSVRIGINTGGPIIAGVLGTDKPVFDIIGDPINIASRLQSTCIPSQIQVSQATHDLISDQDFNIELRGDVFLKGKGKTQTYLVKPQSFLAHFSYISTNSGLQTNA